MADNDMTDDPTFKDLELAGWEQKAGSYDALLGQVTRQAIDPLLDAAGIGEGVWVLDVACGPGYGAGQAAARGADAIGIDISPAMVTEASARFPAAAFRVGDGEALPIDDESVDAVISSFGIMHMPDPETAMTEAYRVVRPGGRYAFTAWAPPDRNPFMGLVGGAIKAHGDTDVPLPPAPDMFRFGDGNECRAALDGAGFADVNVEPLPLVWRTGTAEDFIDIIYRSTVRTAMVMERQASDAAEKIHRAILVGAERFKAGDGYEIGFPAVVVSARKA